MDTSSIESNESYHPTMSKEDIVINEGDEESIEQRFEKSPTNLSRRKSNNSELSKIISGIKDDNNQPYEDIALAELVLAHQLTHQEIQETNDLENNIGTIPSGVSGDNVPQPDEGFAWVIAIISMLAIFATWGSNASYGVFLNYYTRNSTFEGADMYDFALIGGMVVFLAQSTAPITTLLYQIFGLRTIVITGIILQTAGYVLASFAKKLWQLYLTQGLMIGLSFSLVYLPATLVLPTWFDKNRAFAFGIAVSGAGLGGIVFALSVDHVIRISGNQYWGLRLTALIALVSALPNLFLKPRIPTQQSWSKTLNWKFIKANINKIIDPKVFQSWSLRALALWFGLSLLGYVVMLFSLSSYATAMGLSDKQASNLTALLNAGQVIGRPTIGLFSDRLGRVNTASFLGLLIAIMIFAFWINAVTYAALIPYSLIIGGIIGIGSTLCQPIAGDLILDISQLPAAWSMLNICVGFFCLAAEVIALSLKQPNSPKPFLHCQIFAGCCFIACLILSMLIRQCLVQKVLTKRLASTLEAIEEINEPKRYLTINDLNDQSHNLELLNQRRARYEYLLMGGVKHYFIRLFYPLKV